MNIKRSGVLVALVALIGAIVIMLPTLIFPAIANDTVVTYANNTFDSLTSGAAISNDGTNFYTAVPSLAKVKMYKRGGYKGIEVQLKPSSTGADAIVDEITNGKGSNINIDRNIMYRIFLHAKIVSVNFF